MNFFEKLYDELEDVKVRFVGLTTEEKRYDFGIVYTNMFFGKPLVVSMQSGRSTLLDPKDIEDLDYLQKVFQIDTTKEVIELSQFFKITIPSIPFETQYE